MLIKRLISHVLSVYDREKQSSYHSLVDLMLSNTLCYLVFYRVTSHVILLVDISPVSLHAFCYH
jgi:hypothetical protein